MNIPELHVPWLNILLAVFVAYVIFLLYRFHTDEDSDFDASDLLVDGNTGKASLDKFVVLGFALLSGWVVVHHELNGKDVETLLLGILGIFILQRSASKAIDAYGARQADSAVPPNAKEK
jgi:hypothetical protein